MADAYGRGTITAGMDVLGSDEAKVGTVSGILDDYIVVSKGFFFPTDYYIPTTAVSAVSDKVYLNVSRDVALEQGWDAAPSDLQAAEAMDDEGVVDAGLHIDNPVDEQYTMPGQDLDDAVTAGARDVNTPITVPLHEEELHASTRGIERGRAQVEKVVTEQEHAIEVPVNEEYVMVRRETVDRKVAPGETVFTEETIDVPLRGEEVVVDRQVHVVEELVIDTEMVARTEQVAATSRREEVHVYDEQGNLVEDTSTEPGERNR